MTQGNCNGLFIYKDNNPLHTLTKTELVHERVYLVRLNFKKNQWSTPPLYLGVWLAGAERFKAIRFHGKDSNNKHGDHLHTINPDKDYTVMALVDYEKYIKVIDLLEETNKKNVFRKYMLIR
jgi:hypothetical protein